MKIYPKAATLPGKEGAHLQEVWLYLQQIFYPFHSKDMNSNSLTVSHKFIIMLVLKKFGVKIKTNILLKIFCYSNFLFAYGV